jgi:hypothetical protein
MVTTRASWPTVCFKWICCEKFYWARGLRMEGRPGSNRLATSLRWSTLSAYGRARMPGLRPGWPCWRVWKLLHCRAPRCQLQYVPLAWCWLYIASCHVSVGWSQAEYMLLSRGVSACVCRVCVGHGACLCTILETCVSHGVAMSVCVWVCAQIKSFWGVMAETLDQSRSTLWGRCLHLGIMPLYLVWRVPFSGESIHL